MNIESNLGLFLVCFTSLCDWFKTPTPSSRPIKFKVTPITIWPHAFSRASEGLLFPFFWLTDAIAHPWHYMSKTKCISEGWDINGGRKKERSLGRVDPNLPLRSVSLPTDRHSLSRPFSPIEHVQRSNVVITLVLDWRHSIEMRSKNVGFVPLTCIEVCWISTSSTLSLHLTFPRTLSCSFLSCTPRSFGPIWWVGLDVNHLVS